MSSFSRVDCKHTVAQQLSILVYTGARNTEKCFGKMYNISQGFQRSRIPQLQSTKTGADTENTKGEAKDVCYFNRKKPSGCLQSIQWNATSKHEHSQVLFYLRINHTKIKNTKKMVLTGSYGTVNKLFSSQMKTMCKKANLENERLTNHSAWKYIIQTLNNSKIPPLQPTHSLWYLLLFFISHKIK